MSFFSFFKIKYCFKGSLKRLKSSKMDFFDILFIFSLIVHLYLYVSPMTVYDYKLVYYMVAGIIFLHKNYDSEQFKIFLVIFLASLWSSGWGYSSENNMYVVLQALSDFCLLLCTSIFLKYFFVFYNILSYFHLSRFFIGTKTTKNIKVSNESARDD